MIQLDHLPGMMLSSLKTPEVFLDIGSSTTRLLSGGQLLEEATCLAIHQPTGAVVAVGTKAHALLGKTSEKISVHFPIQHGVVANARYLELFLRELLKQRFPKAVLAQVMGFTGAVVLPPTISPADQKVFDRVLQRTNLHRLKKIPSPVAAQAVALPKSQSSAISVCSVDCGAQTTTIAIVSAGEVVHAQTVPIGGVDITRVIQDVVRAELSCAIGWQSAESVKLEIGEVSLDDKAKRKDRQTTVRGKDTVSNVAKTVVVPASLISPQIGLVVAELVESVSVVFSEISSELASSALERGMYLSGAASQLTGLDDYFAQTFQCEVISVKQPSQAVVRGLVESTT